MERVNVWNVKTYTNSIGLGIEFFMYTFLLVFLLSRPQQTMNVTTSCSI